MTKDYINVTDDCVSIDVPSTFGRGGGNIIFWRDHLEYKGDKVNYADIASICYQNIKTSINLIPTAQSYSFRIKSKHKDIYFSMNAALFLGNKKYKDIFSRLVSISNALIEPGLVKRLVFQIFDENKTVKIGNLEISRQGYSVDKFWGGRVQVLWFDTVYTPQVHEGYVNIYKDQGGKGKSICQLSMETDNAVLLPELIRSCFVRSRS